jgi:adenylylsulfate kinase
MKSILIMGLPGSGKTTLANVLNAKLKKNGTTKWFNADAIRNKYDDWDFSIDGRLRQVNRMKQLVLQSDSEFIICDFIAPTKEIRTLFDADYIIWMNTIKEGRYNDTNELFENPINYDYMITDYDTKHIYNIYLDIKNL